MSISITIDDTELQRMLTSLQRKLGDLTPVMRTVASMMESSVQRNFEAGGRPRNWTPSKLVKKIVKKVQVKKRTGISLVGISLG